jgi:hypothetical protein
MAMVLSSMRNAVNTTKGSETPVAASRKRAPNSSIQG